MVAGDWKLDVATGGPLLHLDGSEVEIHPVRPDTSLLSIAPEALAPSQFCVREWEEYIVLGANDVGIVGGVLNQVDRLGKGIFRFRFENQIGRARLHFTLPSELTANLTIEVLSKKYPTPAEHLLAFQALLADLSRYAAQLPFAVTTPTEVAVDESAAAPTPLFLYNFLLHNDEDLRTALNIILATPHRRLGDESSWVSAAEASDVDPEMFLQVLAHPEHLMPARDPSLACAAALGGRVPNRVHQRLPRDSFDTPENRFVRGYLAELVRAAQDVRDQPWWREVPAKNQTLIDDLVGHLTEISRASLFDDVGDMVVFPASSQVLLRRDGYRELLALWRLFQLARQPFFASLQAAIELRDVATLYEFWCFYRLAEVLSKELSCPPHYKLSVTDDKGLEYEASAEFGEQGRLIFNRTFRRRQAESYSVSLRPDFTFVAGSDSAANDRRIIFDAKFRFTTAIWQSEDSDVEARTVERTDLYKMHTYRDALRARSAIVLFPGDQSVFYDTQHKRTASELTLAEMMLAEGIGALKMGPSLEEEAHAKL